MSVSVQLTNAACDRIRVLRPQDGATPYFRVYITGGGCSGFQYKFMMDARQEDDMLVHQADIAVVIDPATFGYLQGATIDYRHDLRGAHFSVENPNATTTCSCGSSFSVD